MSKKTKPPAPEFTKGQQVWISKWALNGEGIMTATFIGKRWSNVETCFDIVLDGKDEPYMLWGTRQIHATEEEARAAANAQRNRRIASLKNQIAKLEQMKF